MASQPRMTRSMARLMARPCSARGKAGSGILFVAGKHADEAVSRADGPLAGADLARVGQEDFGAGEIKAEVHGGSRFAAFDERKCSGDAYHGAGRFGAPARLRPNAGGWSPFAGQNR